MTEELAGEEELQDVLSVSSTVEEDLLLNGLLSSEGYEVATKQEFQLAIMRIQTDAKAKMQAQQAHYKGQFDKLKKKLEERNSLLKERTDKLLRLEAIQSDLREENERMIEEKRGLEKDLHDAKEESDMKIQQLEGTITELRIDVENKEKELVQLKGVMEKSIKRSEISKEDDAKRKEREERRRIRRAKMAEYEKKKAGSAVSIDSDIELKRDPSGAGEESEEPPTKRNPDATQIAEVQEETVDGVEDEISQEAIQESVRNQVTDQLTNRANDALAGFDDQLAALDSELEKIESSRTGDRKKKKSTKEEPLAGEKKGSSSSKRKRRSLRQVVTKTDTKQLEATFSGSYTICGVDQKLGIVFDKKQTRSMKVKKLKTSYPRKLGIVPGDCMTRINGKSLGVLLYKDAVKILKSEPFPWTVEFMRATAKGKAKPK